VRAIVCVAGHCIAGRAIFCTVGMIDEGSLQAWGASKHFI